MWDRGEGPRSAGYASVENWSLEFPRAVDPNYPPFILWPWKLSDMGPIGYMKLPAIPLEFINGAWWLYDNNNPHQLDIQANILTGQGTIQPAPSANQGVLTQISGLPEWPSMFNNPGPVNYATPTLGDTPGLAAQAVSSSVPTGTQGATVQAADGGSAQGAATNTNPAPGATLDVAASVSIP